jgi:DNA mismatch repair protein MutS2
VSGPNAGGKTVVLKTVGILHLMLKSGLLVPADSKSKMFLFSNLYLEIGDSQSIIDNLSTFSAHIKGLKPILEKTSANDLVLLDELAVGTEPHTGSAIAQAVLEHIADQKAHAVITTHFDRLKTLALSDTRFRNGSMEYLSYRPTYRLVMDIPGKSYGIEVAEQMGLRDEVIKRAKSLCGDEETSLDEVIGKLNEATSELHLAKKETEEQKKLLERETELLKQARKNASEDIFEQFEKEFTPIKESYKELLEELRTLKKDVEFSSEQHQKLNDIKTQISQKSSELSKFNRQDTDDKMIEKLLDKFKKKR